MLMYPHSLTCAYTHTHSHSHTHSLSLAHRELESQVSELSTSPATLLSELEKCQSEMKVFQETHSNQLQVLERENDLLRERSI